MSGKERGDALFPDNYTSQKNYFTISVKLHNSDEQVTGTSQQGLEKMMVDQERTFIQIRVWMLGDFLVQRRTADRNWQEVPREEWGTNAHTHRLLQVLWCQGRSARRSTIIEALWDEQEPERADEYLNKAAMRLRHLLQVSQHPDLFQTSKNRSTYQFAEQSRIWVDAQAALEWLQEAERIGRSSPQALSLLQEAQHSFERGSFLEDEGGLWVHGRRGMVEAAAYRCSFWLAEAYMAQGKLTEAETVVSRLYQRDPTDEEALCRWMLLLHQQGMTHQALRLFKETKRLFEQQGMVLSSTIETIAQQLQHPPSLTTSHEFSLPLPLEKPFGQEHRGRVVHFFPHIWNVPYQRNPFFTGRDDVLIHLHTLLNRRHPERAIVPIALCGLGGIGKTQTVLEYTYRYGEEYQAVFWVRADTRENLFSDFFSLAIILGLPQRASQNQAVTMAAIQQWLREHTAWLLIFDNADDLEILRELLPTGCQGHLLLTTRAQAMGGVAHRREMEEMDLSTGALFLLRRANLIELDTPLEKISEKNRTLAEGLARELGGLPLALDQAGAYIEEAALNIAEYGELYHQQKYALLKRRGGQGADHPEPVAMTLALSFSCVEQMDRGAADLLRFCAFLSPDAIAEEVFTKGAAAICSSLAPPGSESTWLHRAVEILRKFSLIRRNAETKILTIHRLVQSSVQGTMDQETQGHWARMALEAVSATFPDEVTVASWPWCQRLLPQVQMCITLVDTYHLLLPEAARLFNQAGYYLRERALYLEAEVLYTKALTIREHALGPFHPEVAQVLYNQARLYYDLGQYAFCETFHLRALEMREQIKPADDLALALSLNSLAFLYYIQERNYDEAERFYQRALQLFETTIGLDHPKTAHCLSNLALLYVSQGKHREAEQLLLRVRTIRERYLGPMHLDTARSLQNLAWFYVHLGKREQYAEAKRLLERSLAIRKTLLGAEHPQVAISLHHLALFYEAQGDDAEAKILYQQVLSIRRNVMGDDNPKVLLTEASYAALLRKMGQPQEAAQLEASMQAVQNRC